VRWAAATALAGELHLRVDDAVVIHNSNKLALRLLPCGVFARVALAGHEAAPAVPTADRQVPAERHAGSGVEPNDPRAAPLPTTRASRCSMSRPDTLRPATSALRAPGRYQEPDDRGVPACVEVLAGAGFEERVQVGLGMTGTDGAAPPPLTVPLVLERDSARYCHRAGFTPSRCTDGTRLGPKVDRIQDPHTP
jgi:hypothetical protein